MYGRGEEQKATRIPHGTGQGKTQQHHARDLLANDVYTDAVLRFFVVTMSNFAH